MKLHYKYLLLLLFAQFLSNNSLYGQSNFWPLGNKVALDFIHDPPELLMIKTHSDKFTGTTISAPNGRSLFYDNNDFLFDKDNDSIFGSYAEQHYFTFGPNLERILLPSVGKLKGSCFYVSTKIKNSNSNYLTYTEVDMYANQGKGKIIEKDKIFGDFYFGNFGMAATYHTNGKDIWLVLVSGTDSVYSFLLTENGFQPPVISNLNTLTKFKTSVTGLSFSNNGNKLAISRQSQGTNNPGAPQFGSYLHIADFDKSTGRINKVNQVEKYEDSNVGLASYQFFAVAFSPNDSFLYLADPRNERIVQYETYAKNVQGSAVLLFQPGIINMRLAANGKIYALANYGKIKPALWTIYEPDKKGSLCRIIKNNNIKLPEYNIALPNIFNSYTRIKFSTGEACEKTVFHNLSDTNYFRHFTWYFGDGDSAVGLNVTHAYKSTGKYLVKLKAAIPEGYFAWYSDTVHFQAKDMVKARFGFKANTGCQWVGFSFTDSSVYNKNKPGVKPQWLWHFGDGETSTLQNPKHIYTKPGKYLIKLIFTDGFCTDTFLNTQEITIISAPKPGFTVSQNSGCAPLKVMVADKSQGQVIKYNYTFGDGRNDTINNPQVTFTKPGTYKIMQALTGPTGCITYDSAEIQVFTPLDISRKLDIHVATVKSNNSVSIHWQKIPHAATYHLSRSTDSFTWISLPALRDTFYTDNEVNTQTQSYFYRLVYMDSCGNTSLTGEKSRTILLRTTSNEPQNISLSWNFYQGRQMSDHKPEFHSGDTLWQILNTGTEQNFVHDDYAKGERIFSCYRVKATASADTNIYSYSNVSCVPLKSLYFIPNAFSPDNDGLNDYFEIETIGVISAEISIYNRLGVKVYETYAPEKISWDGKFKNKPLPVGLYHYTLIVTGSNFEKTYKTGIINLIR